MCFEAGGTDFRNWPIAPNFSLGPDVSFRREAEVGRAAEPSASVENDPSLPLGMPIFCDAQGRPAKQR